MFICRLYTQIHRPVQTPKIQMSTYLRLMRKDGNNTSAQFVPKYLRANLRYPGTSEDTPTTSLSRVHSVKNLSSSNKTLPTTGDNTLTTNVTSAQSAVKYSRVNLRCRDTNRRTRIKSLSLALIAANPSSLSKASSLTCRFTRKISLSAVTSVKWLSRGTSIWRVISKYIWTQDLSLVTIAEKRSIGRTRWWGTQ